MRTNLAKLPYLLLALVVAGSVLFYTASAAAIFDSFLNATRVRLPFQYAHTARFLVQPLPESRRAGMHPDDEVLSVNGVRFTGMAGVIAQTFHAHPGQVLAILYRNRVGEVHTAQVELTPRRRVPPTVSGWFMNVVLVLLFPAFCLLLGFWVVLARPLDWNAWFLLGIMNVVPAFIARTGYFPGFLTPFTVLWQIFAERWMFISLILFTACCITFTSSSRISPGPILLSSRKMSSQRFPFASSSVRSSASSSPSRNPMPGADWQC
jgi:sigma-B regulation protein RsbU (phosphoserine phosphatase)